MSHQLCLVSLLSFGLQFSSPLAAADSTDIPVIDSTQSTITLTIEHLLVDDMSLYDTLDIILDAGARQVAGFGLKFAINSPYVDIVEVLKGEIPDSCEWELFRAGPVAITEPDGLPATIWSVTALAKFSPDTTTTACLGLGRPATVARLVVSSLHAPQVPDTVVPIFFFWQDCRDNALSNANGDKLMVSLSVTDQFPQDYETTDQDFPNRSGTPGSCIRQGRSNAPKREINLFNGGIEFRLSLGEPE